jgi:hypothetical protein
MDYFNFLLTVHLLGAMVWIGGGIAVMVIGKALVKSAPSSFPGFCSTLAKLGGPLFGGSGGIVLLTGILMVVEREDYEFSAPWIGIGIAGWLVSTVFGATQLGKAWDKAGSAVASGANSESVTPLVNRAAMMTSFDIAIRIFVVAIMVWRPS